jgi:hypothetical protein
MKRNETQRDVMRKPARRRPNAWNKVFDRRKKRVRGLWERNGVYYAQLRIRGKPIRFKLDHTTTVPQAVEEMQALKRQDAKASYQARENRRRWVAKNPSRHGWIHSARLQGHRFKKWTSA